MIIINMTSFIYPSRHIVYASEHMHVVGCVRLGTFVISVCSHMHIYARVCVCECVCVRRWLIGMPSVSGSPVVLGGIGSICHLCRDPACCRLNP